MNKENVGKNNNNNNKPPPIRKLSGPSNKTAEFNQTFKEGLKPSLVNLFQKLLEEGTTLRSSCKPSPTLIQNQRHHKKRKLEIKIDNAKIINKMTANKIQQHTKKTTHVRKFHFCTARVF